VAYEIRLGRNRITARVTDGHLVELSRGEPRDRPDTIIDTDPETLNRVLARTRHSPRPSTTGDSRSRATTKPSNASSRRHEPEPCTGSTADGGG
jgi:hypothetical protein